MTHRRSQRALAVAIAAAAFAAFIPAAPAVAASDTAVAHVSLLIGNARVVRADGSTEALRRGAQIVVGDRIETSANGHVHLRFTDNGAASVRPDSVLEVLAYRYDAHSPKDSEVRLRVEQGVARSISGAATDADKSRFRLNTPIAAIGVRGTDFIVQTGTQGMRAMVADGAIVVGALGGACSAAALGPCTGGDARVLSADMGRMVAEMRPGERIPRVVPAGAGVADLAAHGAEERAAALYAAESAARLAGQQAAETKGFAQMRETDRASADLLKVVQPEFANLNSAPDLKSQLLWGRWGAFTAPNDRVSVPYVLAQSGREITSATFSQNDGGLFRATDPSGLGVLVNDKDARVDFRLSRAQASYSIDNKVEPAAVAGALSIDFSQRTFLTLLSLASSSGVTANLRAGGDVSADGTFAVRDSLQKVSGAISFDSKEVGYLFERLTGGGGLFKGRTLWGR